MWYNNRSLEAVIFIERSDHADNYAMTFTESLLETKLMTGEELMALGDIGPCELIEGRVTVVSPTKPRHGRYEYRLARAIGTFVDEQDLGEVQVGEVGLYIRRNPDTIRAADLLFISHERLARATPDSFLDVAPELVAEILSPDDRWSQVKEKLNQYFEIGVVVVLIVNPNERTVSVYRSPDDVQQFGENDVLSVEEVLPGFYLALIDLFRPDQK